MPFTDAEWQDFKDQLDTIHAQAERHPGFIWRYKGEDDPDGYIKPWPSQPMIMGNLTAWKDYQSLFDFTFNGDHLEIMKQKKRWFEPLPRPWNVLFYGSVTDVERFEPSYLLERAISRFAHLQRFGESSFAFGFKKGLV